MPHRHTVEVRTVGRRGVVLGGLGAIAVFGVGCDAATEAPNADEPHQQVTPTAKAVDVDSDLVDEMGRAVAETAAVVAAVRRAAPSLRRRTDELKRLHEAHLQELGWSGSLPRTSAIGRARAEARLTEAEEKLRSNLIDGCVRAHSGALAQLLAAMAAAVAQRQVALT